MQSGVSQSVITFACPHYRSMLYVSHFCICMCNIWIIQQVCFNLPGDGNGGVEPAPGQPFRGMTYCCIHARRRIH
jgi:hypothetical protein